MIEIGGERDVSTTHNEIVATEARLKALRDERTRLAAELEATRTELARAKFEDVAPAAKTKSAERDVAAALQATDAAIAIGTGRIVELRERAAREIEEGRFATEVSEMRAVADALPQIAERLDEVIGLVEKATRAIGRRPALYAALGSAFRQAVMDSNVERPASVKGPLSQLARNYARDAARATAAPSPFPPGPPARALLCDTAIYALKSFRWCDRHSTVARVDVAAGAVMLVPGVVAEAGVRERVCERLSAPAGVRVTMLRAWRDESCGRAYARGETVVPADVAHELISAGIAEPRERLTASEVAVWRSAGKVEREPTMRIDLGVFNDATADGMRALDEVADLDAEGDDESVRPAVPAQRGNRESVAALAAKWE